MELSFFPNTVCDLELEAVEYTREWIALHGDEEIES